MFPEETHIKILQRLDEMEAEMFHLYRKLERFRLGLQEQWKALPSGDRWTQEKHDASAFNGR